MGPSAARASRIKCSIQSSKLDITSLLLNLLLRLRMTKLLLLLFLMVLLNWTRKSSVLATLKFSSELVFLATWRKYEKIRLDLYFHGFRPELEASLLVCSLRNCKIRNLLSIVVKDMAMAPDLAGNQAKLEVYSVWKIQERI